MKRLRRERAWEGGREKNKREGGGEMKDQRMKGEGERGRNGERERKRERRREGRVRGEIHTAVHTLNKRERK